MALIKKYQNSFTTGVISPGLYARVDLSKYEAGCKEIVNGIVHAHGGISNRPGTYLVDELPGGGLLIPFTYSVDQAYVLALYDPRPNDSSPHKAKMRIYKDGGVVTNPNTGFVAVIDTPYLTSEISGIRFAQSADTMFLAHPAHPPHKLVRSAHYVWTFSPLSFYPSIAAPQGLTAKASGFKDDSGTYVETTAEYKVSAVDDKGVESMPSNGVTANILSTWPTGAKVELAWKPVEGASHYEVYKNTRGYYAWLGSAEATKFKDDNIEGDSGTGPKENRDPFNPPATPEWVTLDTKGDGTSGKRVIVRVSAANSSGAESAALGEQSIISNLEDVTVWMPQVESGELYYAYFRYEDSDEWRYVTAVRPDDPDENVSIPLDKSSQYQNGAPLDVPNCYPGAVGIYQQRLVFGRTNAEPQTVWLSETGAFDSMAVSNPLRDDNAIVATVDSKQMNEIRHFIPLRDVLMLTSGAEFQLSAGNNSDAVTPTSISFRLQSYWGCSNVPPIVSGVNVVFAENSGKVVRDLRYQLTDDGYTGSEVSILVDNLIDSPIWDWAYQQSPWSTIWICLKSGKLLTFTYMREQEVWAWSEHESSGGKFISVSSIREGEDDNVYFITQRFGKYFVEYQKRREYGDDMRDAFYVDCGLVYRGTAIKHVTGLEHLAGQEIAVLADGAVVRGIVVNDDGSFDLPTAASFISAGLGYKTRVRTLDPDIKSESGTTLGMRKNVVRVAVQLRESRGLWIGADDSSMVELKFPSPDKWSEPPELFSGCIETAIPGKHREEADIVFEQRDPLPMTVLALATTVSIG